MLAPPPGDAYNFLLKYAILPNQTVTKNHKEESLIKS